MIQMKCRSRSACIYLIRPDYLYYRSNNAKLVAHTRTSIEGDAGFCRISPAFGLKLEAHSKCPTVETVLAAHIGWAEHLAKIQARFSGFQVKSLQSAFLIGYN